MPKKVLIAMSGGVDSSVAAFLLKEQGYICAGVTMCLGITRAGAAACCGKEAIDDARSVCDMLGIGHYVFDFSKVFQSGVVKPFAAEYAAGRTPNPCVWCNTYLKFGVLLEKARALGFDYLATGHYAKIISQGAQSRLVKSNDAKKDQTYFLWGIKKEFLSHILFPLAEYTKAEVRVCARRAKLPVAEKKESFDICFVAEKDYAGFLAGTGVHFLPGAVVDTKGKVLGRHRGIINYTIGQRQGLGISAKTPLYVVALEAETNTVVVGGKKDLLAKGLLADSCNVLTDVLPVRAVAKIRYASKETSCHLSREHDIIKVTFDSPQESVTPGQSIVLYQDGTVLAGGVIREALR